MTSGNVGSSISEDVVIDISVFEKRGRVLIEAVREENKAEQQSQAEDSAGVVEKPHLRRPERYCLVLWSSCHTGFEGVLPKRCCPVEVVN